MAGCQQAGEQDGGAILQKVAGSRRETQCAGVQRYQSSTEIDYPPATALACMRNACHKCDQPAFNCVQTVWSTIRNHVGKSGPQRHAYIDTGTRHQLSSLPFACESACASSAAQLNFQRLSQLRQETKVVMGFIMRRERGVLAATKWFQMCSTTHRLCCRLLPNSNLGSNKATTELTSSADLVCICCGVQSEAFQQLAERA